MKPWENGDDKKTGDDMGQRSEDQSAVVRQENAEREGSKRSAADDLTVVDDTMSPAKSVIELEETNASTTDIRLPSPERAPATRRLL